MVQFFMPHSVVCLLQSYTPWLWRRTFYLYTSETTSSVAVTIRPTVPISCPPCSLTLRIANPVGLTVSTCSVTFTYRDSPMTARTIKVRAVPTLGTYSRWTQLPLRPVETYITGSGWDNYIVPQIYVSTLRLHLPSYFKSVKHGLQ